MASRYIVIKANLALPYLVYYARNQKTITYKKLGEIINYPPRGMGHLLGYIRDEICRKRGVPMLNVIVVNSETGLPGASCFSIDTSQLTENAYRKRVKDYQAEVFNYHDWDLLLNEMNLGRVSE